MYTPRMKGLKPDGGRRSPISVMFRPPEVGNVTKNQFIYEDSSNNYKKHIPTYLPTYIPTWVKKYKKYTPENWRTYKQMGGHTERDCVFKELFTAYIAW